MDILTKPPNSNTFDKNWNMPTNNDNGNMINIQGNKSDELRQERLQLLRGELNHLDRYPSIVQEAIVNYHGILTDAVASRNHK